MARMVALFVSVKAPEYGRAVKSGSLPSSV